MMPKPNGGDSSPVSVSPQPRRSASCACALLGCSCLGMLMIPVGLGLVVYFYFPQIADFFWQSIRSVAPYQMTLEKLREDPRISDQLGSDWVDQAPDQFRYHEKNQSGSAYFRFTIQGSNGAGQVVSHAEKVDGHWKLTRVAVEIGEKTVNVVGQGALPPPPPEVPAGPDDDDLF